MVQSGHGHRALRWRSVRVVQQMILTLTPQGTPIALPKGTVLFGPIAQTGEFATMMQDSEYYKCHVDELLRYTKEAGSATSDTPQDKVA